MTAKTFKELELGGWTDRAAAYDSYFALITNQAIDPILDSFGTLKGKPLLDIGCGTGHLSAAAAKRGAETEGIDFARTMIATAAANYPEITFTEGDAECLPFENGRFDCVACSFGLLHMQQPERAMMEACRVLRNGGRYTFTVWCTPEQGSDLFGIIQRAIQAHGIVEVGLPPAPPFFRFANAEECHNTLTAAGFLAPETSKIPLHGTARLLAISWIFSTRAPFGLQWSWTDKQQRPVNGYIRLFLQVLNGFVRVNGLRSLFLLSW